MANNLFILDIDAPSREQDRLRVLMADLAPWGWIEEETEDRLLWQAHFDSLTRLDNAARLLEKMIPGLSCSHRFEKNQHWQENWKKFFTPIYIEDRIMVVPSWLAHTPFSGMSIVIEPKMAFGTGHHATTTLCLREIDRGVRKGLLKPEYNFLDLGTGSGILGIACAKHGMTGLGLDIEGTAIDNARENIGINRVKNQFVVREGSLQEIGKGEKYHLIVANILAGPLMEMCTEIVDLLPVKDYCLILSGILGTQAERVAKTYQAAGLGEPDISVQDEWSALVWFG